MLARDAVNTIVNTDTHSLIAEADNIVRSCTGTNCNTSDMVRTHITKRLSELAQDQSAAVLILLSVPSSSTLGRSIYESYLNLGAAVASVYNFQCGNNITNSNTCVSTASSVLIAQSNLENLLIQPTTNQINHIVILSILFSIAIISLLIFFIFFIIGLFETDTQISPQRPVVIQPISPPVIIQPTHVNIKPSPVVIQPPPSVVIQPTHVNIKSSPVVIQPTHVGIRSTAISTPASPF